MKAALAELIGTFTLTFIGAGAGALAGSTTGAGGIVAVALAHGIALMVIVYTWGKISGAHVNPAVTLGLLVGGRVPVGKAISYWIAQFAGAGLAGLMVLVMVDHVGTDSIGETVGVLTLISTPKTILLEAVLTFFLVCAVYSSGVAGRNGNAAGLAIGLVLTMDILMGGYLTGASMNPARSFGPALAAGNLGSYYWLYVVGPAIGGIVAGLVYNLFFMDED
ncbi:MAG: aquaporin [Pirellulales bacterium]|nr:aquaporin [Pirellulales bacterium]